MNERFLSVNGIQSIRNFKKTTMLHTAQDVGLFTSTRNFKKTTMIHTAQDVSLFTSLATSQHYFLPSNVHAYNGTTEKYEKNRL
jgi:hypothetical protein